MPISPETDPHLYRTMLCKSCGWSGESGEIIVRDKFRCPRCDSDQVATLRHPGTEARP